MNTQLESLTLDDNRRLAFADLGNAEDPPLFFFHGSGSASDGLDLAHRARQHGVRIVSPARPGIGGSTPSPGRTMSDWVLDIVQLADHLQLDQFALLGISGGGPYALAAAAGLPERVKRVGVLSCGGPFDIPDAFDGMARANRIMWSAIDRRPRLAKFMLGQQAKLVNKGPAKAADRAIRMLAGADKDAVAQLTATQQRAFFADSMVEALADGPQAMFEDMAILRRPWDFDVSTLNQRVDLWHGDADGSAPVVMAEYLAKQIPNASLHLGVNSGHLSTILNEIDAALVMVGDQNM